MSGVEVAGLVLAAFPLMISALEHYRDSARILGFWRHFRHAHQKCKTDVKYHELIYRRNLKRLLLPTVSDEAQLQALLADPSGAAWKDATLIDRLKERLGDSYDVYMDLMDRTNEVVKEIGEELGLDKKYFFLEKSSTGQLKPSNSSKPSKADLFSKSQLEFQSQRVVFSFNEPKRIKLFGELQDCNEKLEKVLETGDKVVELQQDFTTASRSNLVENTLEQYWCHASRLFQLISNAWNCNCRQHHIANLLLQHHKTTEVVFDISFLCTRGSATADSWSPQRTKINLIEAKKRPTTNMSETRRYLAAAPPLRTSRLALASKIVDKSGEGNNTRTKSLPTRSNFKPRVTFTVTEPTPETKAAINPRPMEITNLCEVMSKCNTMLPCLGNLRDDSSEFTIFPTDIPDTQATLVSLDHLLSTSGRTRIGRRQRYHIALTLASSYCRLGYSPWIEHQWSKSDILFPCKSDGTVEVHTVEPYVSRTFHEVEQTEKRPVALGKLGIILLELCFGQLLQDNQIRSRLPLGDEYTKETLDIAAALQWSALVEEEAGEKFANAVNWCLSPGRVAAGKNTWRRELWQNVVAPLESIQQDFM